MITIEDRQRCSDGWYQYHGFRYSAEKLLLCDGCQMDDDEDPVRYINCLIRRCALKIGVETCAHCSAYPCEELVSRAHGEEWREEIEVRLGEPISEADYLAFVEPYEGLTHLENIRAFLRPGDIIEMNGITVKFQTAEFPDGLTCSEDDLSAYEALHRLMLAFNTHEDRVSYARQEVLKERRRHLLKLLWAFGLSGELGDDGGNLVVDSRAYYAHQGVSYYSRLQDLLNVFGEYGVHCKVVPLAEDEWLTPTGAMREKVGREGKPAWQLIMSIDDQAGGEPVLGALQSYAVQLDEVYGKQAYRRFAKADMRVLREM
jgi:hypothetical protein